MFKWCKNLEVNKKTGIKLGYMKKGKKDSQPWKW